MKKEGRKTDGERRIRERERGKERERQTADKENRQAVRQAYRETERQTDELADTHTYIHTYRQTDKEREKMGFISYETKVPASMSTLYFLQASIQTSAILNGKFLTERRPAPK
jgi:hypothetical protein